ncbi:MAG: glycosyltransferase family 2 protein [Sodaliphilus sp.]
MNELVSVIVPAYNVAPYLEQCLESIAAQTYTHLEVIVVDDGSTDASGAIADEWAARDPRVRVIHQPNAGLSAARNSALNVMQGAYVTFIDSDDFVAPQYVERLMHYASDADAVLCGWVNFSDDDTIPAPSTCGKVRTYTAFQAVQHILYQRHGLTHSAWGRIYRAHIFKDVRFPKGMLYEDLAVLMPVMQQVSRLIFLPERLYYYRQRPGSILATFNPRRTHVLDILEDMERRAPEQWPEHLPAIRSRLLSAYFNMFRIVTDPRGAHAPIISRAWAGIRRLRRGCLLNRHVRPRNKAAILLTYILPTSLLHK